MESEKAGDSRDFTENYQTTDLAILQSLALRSRIVLRFLFRQLELVTVFIPWGRLRVSSVQLMREVKIAHCDLLAVLVSTAVINAG